MTPDPFAERLKGYSAKTLAALWDVSESTINRLIERGDLERFPVGDGSMRIKHLSAAAHMERRQQATERDVNVIDLPTRRLDSA